MQNLLRQPLPRAEITSILAATPHQPLLPPMGDPAWQAAANKPAVQKWLGQIRPKMLTEADERMPELTPELYAIFPKTGERYQFETLYFERRRRLARAAMVALLDPSLRDQAIASMVRKLAEIMDEPAWCFPAHSGTPTGIAPTNIDLFDAECANQIGECFTLFPNVFPAALEAAARKRIHDQIFARYLEHDFPWARCTNNWNAVCHQGVLGAAMALVDDPDLLAQMLARMADNRLIQFLNGYTPDGGSSEGPGYWSYGFGWFTELNRQLETRTAGRLSIFHEDPLVAKIARFGPALTLSNNKLVNFSDSGNTGPLSPSLLTYLAARMQDPSLTPHAIAAYRHVATHGIATEGQRCDILNLTRVILRCPEAIPEHPPELPMHDVFLPDLEVMVARGRDANGHLWEFAAKAGHNEENHNHNDIGSFLLNIDGQRMLLELGAPQYDRAFFRAETRYTYLAARSLGHSLPLINNVEQHVGEQFRGRILSHTLDASRARLEVEFTHAYPKDAGLIRGVRTFELDKKAGKLTVTDAFSLSRLDTLDSALILPAKPTLHPDGSATFTVDSLTLRITPAAGTRISEAAEHSFKTHYVPGELKIHRLAMVPAQIAADVTVAYSVTLG